FRDGIRHIIFRPELTPDELLRFVLICMADLRSGENLGKDMMALMWEAGFESIEYIAVEGFSIDDMSDEEVEVEVDKIVGYLYNRLKSHSEDFLRFARLSAEDLEMQLDQVEQIRGAVIAGQPCSPEQAAELQEEIVRDLEDRMLPKLVTIVFQVVDEAGDEIGDQAIREVFTQLLDAMLLQEDFATVNQIVTKFKALERDPGKGQRIMALKESFIQKMGESERLDKVGEILNTGRPKNLKEVLRYLFTLDTSAVVPLLEILDRIEIPEHRKVVCDALVTLGRENADPFINRLESERSQLVRDMIYIIDRIDFPDKVKMFGRVLSNPNLAVRLEALGIIARSKSEDCRQLVADCLEDPTKEMRLQAARLLPKYDDQKAYVDLARLVRSEEFEKRDLKEKVQIYAALGSTQQQGALALFAGMLRKKGIFNKKKLLQDKLLAISGLSNLASIPSFQLLQAEAKNKSNPEQIQMAARRGMLAVKKELFGDEGEGDEV
ncbi:MAG: HEAT repeat domain-containing protein, partial [Myxococcota bacterium]